MENSHIPATSIICIVLGSISAEEINAEVDAFNGISKAVMQAWNVTFVNTSEIAHPSLHIDNIHFHSIVSEVLAHTLLNFHCATSNYINLLQKT